MNFSNSNVSEEVIRQCINGEQNAQKFIYSSFFGKMLVVCMRYASDKDEAKDILHDGFLKLFVNIRSYGFKGSFDGWVHRLFVNHSIDHIRRSPDFVYDLALEQNYESIEAKDYDIEADKLQNLKTEVIVEMIQNLSPAYKAVFNLYVIEGFSHREIAERLGISEGSSKSNLAKAKRKLVKLVNKKFEKIEERATRRF